MANVIKVIIKLYSWLPSPIAEICLVIVFTTMIIFLVKLFKMIKDILPFA